MNEYTHRPTKVRATQVVRPYKKVADAIPFARVIQDRHTRKFQYIQISKPGNLEFILRAYEGDWILNDPDTGVAVMDDEMFRRNYSVEEDDVDSDPAGED